MRAAVAMDRWKPRNGARYTVTGAPVVVSDLTGTISSSMRVLLVVALLVMAAMLALVFRRRLRLLPLAIALAACALTFGALSLFGASLTMASIAVLPVLIGLAVDYAIQLQSRIAEERGSGDRGRRCWSSRPRRAARRCSARPPSRPPPRRRRRGSPCSRFSPVPMVRGFGILLVAGIAIAFALALLAGTAALVLADRAAPAPPDGSASCARAVACSQPQRCCAAGRRRPPRDPSRRCCAALAYAGRRPARVLAIAFAFAACGWALDTQTRVESDIQRLVPQDMPALRDLDALQRSTGVGGEIDVVIRGADLTSPRVIGWMIDYQSAVLKDNGFSASARLRAGRAVPRVLAARPLHDHRLAPRRRRRRRAAGRRAAVLLALGDQRRPAHRDARLRHPPDGTGRAGARRRGDARPAGRRPPARRARAARRAAGAGRRRQRRGVLERAADADAARRAAAVALVLLAAFRNVGRALVPLVPIALATGWSALVLFALRVPLNPMSVTLGALVIAISTEFSVLLSERYREERGRGHEPRDALARTYRSTGAAVLASGATAIAGFAVLVVSDIRMLRDFGFVTVVDLTVSLLGVLVVLPAVLLIAERRRGGLTAAPGQAPWPEPWHAPASSAVRAAVAVRPSPPARGAGDRSSTRRSWSRSCRSPQESGCSASRPSGAG